jgi:hypothetical protein
MQSKLRAIFEAICGVLFMGDAPTDALLHSNEPSGIPFSGTRCHTGYWLANSSLFFLLSFNGSNNLLLHQKVEPGAGSVVESVRRGVSHSLFPTALDNLSGSSLASGFDEHFDRGSFSFTVLFYSQD